MADAVLLPAARGELRAAVGWYPGESPTTTRRFVAAIDRVLADIVAHPTRHERIDEEYRHASVGRFPHVLISRVDQAGDVLIAAVAHTSREPENWRPRA